MSSHAGGPYRSTVFVVPPGRLRRRLPLLALAAVVVSLGAARDATAPPREAARPTSVVRRDEGTLRPVEGVVRIVEMRTPDGTAVVAHRRDGSLLRLTLESDAPVPADRVALRALAAPFVCTPRGGMTVCFERYQPTGFHSDRLVVSSRDGVRAGLTCNDGYDTSPPWTLSGTLLTHSDRVVCLRESDGRATCLSLQSVSYGEDSREWDSDCEAMASSRVTTAVAVQGMAVRGAEACAWTAAGALHCADLLFASSEVVSFRAVGALAGVERVWLGARRGSLCARDGRGRVWCRGAWGPEVYDPVDAERPPPHDAFAGGEALREVPELAGAEEMLWSEGESACAILPHGRAACWGWNHRGAVADGEVIRRVTPSLVAAAPGAVSLSAGARHACAALHDGRLVCWGDNDHGQLGDGALTPSATPHPMVLPARALEVAAGADHTCARTEGDGLWCWGEGDQGQLGDGAGHDARSPIRVAALDDAVELAAGAEHTCARTAAGEVYCWGRFGCGWPGRPGVRGALRPLRVELPGPVVALRSLGAFACAELAAGGVRCWGMQEHSGYPEVATGRCPAESVTFALRRATLAGRPSSSSSNDLRVGDPAEVVAPSIADVAAVAEAEAFACAMTRGGAVWCWGDNDAGQLGDGRELRVTTPRIVLEATP